MRRYLGLLFFLTTISYSQNYHKVDSLVSLYPKNFNKIEDLVSKIAFDFSTNEEKIRAVFYWVSTSISYDVDFSMKIEKDKLNAFSYKTTSELIQKEKKFNSELALKTFNTKLGVCHGYSAVFNELVSKLGIEAKLIRGDLKSNPFQIGNNIDVNHGWNVVKINEQWKFVDCTLASGKISSKTQQFVFDYNDVYFFQKPELFFLNHYPEDEKWLLVKNKSKIDYTKLPLYYVDYFSNQSNIVLPSEGLITTKNNFIIDLKNFDFESNYLQYIFSSDKNRSNIELNPNSTQFIISLENRSNQILNIFINGKPLVSYLVR